MPGPTLTLSTEGQNNAGATLYSNTLGAGASATATVDFSTASLGGDIAVKGTTNTAVAGTNGIKIEIFCQRDAAADLATVPTWTYTFTPVVASTPYAMVFRVPTGIYSVKVTNLDGTNTLTSVTITSSKLS